MKIKDLREKSIAELEKELEASQKEVFSLRLQQSIVNLPLD
ncbi:MAG TPA: 50S ribosomal protein L29, partial [Gammaproteobacteria bacterium]|nr:50S ribosomal protein L29 [Gammaproteobacteria bacterium]